MRALSIGVLVLNYKTWDLAFRALNAAIRLESEEISEYVLFDDGSPTPPPAGVDSRIRLIPGGVNRGYAAALKVAFGEMKSDIVVVFDADAYPLTPFTACVRERFENDESLGQLGFRGQDHNGAPTGSFLSEPTIWSLLLGQRLYASIPRRELQPFKLCVFSCCMATRRETYEQIGGIDENFDFLDADIDYSMRLRRNGWMVATDPSLKVFHVGGGTPQLQRHRLLRFYKNRWYLLRKHNLIKHANLARTFILARLFVERTMLRLFGKFFFRNPDVLADKVLGRQELISYCRAHYR